MDVHTERGLGRDFPTRITALAVGPELKEGSSETGWEQGVLTLAHLPL